MLEIGKKYRICRHAYQDLFYEIAETFMQYINTLAADEIEQLDADLKHFKFDIFKVSLLLLL